MSNNKGTRSQNIPDNITSGGTDSNNGSNKNTNGQNSNSKKKIENSNPRASGNMRRFRENYNRRAYIEKSKASPQRWKDIFFNYCKRIRGI